MDNRPHFKPGAVKYTRGYGIRIFFSKLITVIMIAIALAIVCITIYVYISQPVKYIDGNEYITANIVHRMLKPGDEVIIVETENYSIFTPLQRFIIPQVTYKAEIIAGPYGNIKSTEDENEYLVVYAGDNIEVNLVDLNQEYLDQEYIIRKIDEYGNYSNETDKITTKNEILGLVSSDK